MAYTTVKKSTSYVTAKELTANQGGNMVVTGVGFQPDMVWLKARDLSANWKQYDAVRGVEKKLEVIQQVLKKIIQMDLQHLVVMVLHGE